MSKYNISTNKLSFDIATEPLKFNKVTHLGAAQFCNPINSEFFRVRLDEEDKWYSASDFKLTSVEEHKDSRYTLLKFNLEQEEVKLSASVDFLADNDGTVELIITMWNTSYKPTQYARLQLPFLSDGQNLGLDQSTFHAPGAPFYTCNGQQVIDPHQVCDPVMSFVRNDGIGLDIRFEAPTDVNTITKTRDFRWMTDEGGLKNYEARTRIHNYPEVIYQMRFMTVNNGWLETFKEIKTRARAKLDLDNYKRDDLKWYDDLFIHQFAYAYGKEAYDYETGKFRLAELLEDGKKEFGGYDIICLWHQYPRLGVDARSQWEFFEDFPGGIDGIIDAVKVCHEHGSRLLLPYKPWDAPDHLSMDDTTQMLVDMIKKTGIDGFYLDTMENVPVKFRRAVDEAVPGVVFCTELQPIDGKTVETLTGSWQQSAALPYQVPILRYIVPEHHSPFIDRWTIDSKRDDMLKKAIVNGSGVVIWQDVFGTWLPFEEYQKANVRKWKAIWSENKECFNSNEVIPVWPSLDNKLVINAFISETTETAIFTAYNDGDEAVDGKIALPVHSGVARVSELWSDNKVWIEDGAVCAHIEPKQVAIIRMEK